MNKSKIDWTEYTWNPITGCLRGCRYCYAKKQSLRFAGDVRLNLMDPRCVPGPQQGTYILDNPYITRKDRSLSFPFGFAPTLHRYRLDWPAKMIKGGNIFVGSMADMFGPWVPDEWLHLVFQACMESPQHNYLFLTKYPERYGDLIDKDLLPKWENFWYGTTVTGIDELGRIGYLPLNAKFRKGYSREGLDRSNRGGLRTRCNPHLYERQPGTHYERRRTEAGISKHTY